jgi:5-hydroxytryptamine receptor 1
LAVVLDRDGQACRILLLIYPVDYSLLLSCLLLAAIDRYVSIVRYEWYKANVTNRWVVLLIAVVSVVSFSIITSPFWTGYQSIDNCTVNLTHVNRVFVWNLLLGLVCVVLHLNIFIRTRALVRQYVPSSRQTPITVRFVRSTIGPSNASCGITFFKIYLFLHLIPFPVTCFIRSLVNGVCKDQIVINHAGVRQAEIII